MRKILASVGLDYFEKNGMYLPNGGLIKTDYQNPDADGDGLLDGEEIDTEMIQHYPGMPSDVVSNQRYFFLYSSYPDRVDSDWDELFDDEEYYLGTDLLDIDTDNDGLTDSSEVDLWYDPLNANPDGDSYSDYEENERDTSPFVYHMNEKESFLAFLKGAAHGEFETASSTEMLLGQVATCFVPFVADARDYIANVFFNCDTGAALANLGGFLLEFAPGLGVAGDVPKALLKVGNFVAKYADDARRFLLLLYRQVSFSKITMSFSLYWHRRFPQGQWIILLTLLKAVAK